MKKALKEFRSYLSPSMSSKIEVVNATQCEWVEKAEYNQHRPLWFPSKKGGVYLLFDSEGRLLYVGVARVNFDKRVWAHKAIHWRYLDVIPFENKYLFLASALEEFLFGRLHPSANKVLNR